MNVAIIGSGSIGGGLGRAWAKKGHQVIFGARDPQDAELAALCKKIGARAASIADAVKGAEVVALAVPYAAAEQVLSAGGDWAGKTVIDCTNAVGPGMVLKYGHTTSSAEELQKKIPQAHVFKSFNAQSAENLDNPVYGGVPASNFFCGDDAKGREQVRALVADVGFEPVDVGPLQNARLLEPLMLVWVAASRSLGSREVAFKMLRR
jgi:predicted dinucleotide-binding enzyme